MASACSTGSWRTILRADFYHLGRSAVEQVFLRIAQRTLADGGRLLVVSADDALAGRLDAFLWSHEPTAFLPHGRSGQGDEATQPVLIAPTPDAANGARFIALVDGVWRDEALGFERAFYLFDDRTIEEARAVWRSLGDREGIERQFWKQDEEGRWRQQA